jgi:hypothetical protein
VRLRICSKIPGSCQRIRVGQDFCKPRSTEEELEVGESELENCTVRILLETFLNINPKTSQISHCLVFGQLTYSILSFDPSMVTFFICKNYVRFLVIFDYL